MADVYLLVAAYRRDHASHEAAARRLREMTVRPFAISVLAAVGFLRVVTLPRVFDEPTPMAHALQQLGDIRGHHHATVIAPGPRHLELVTSLCRDTSARGA